MKVQQNSNILAYSMIVISNILWIFGSVIANQKHHLNIANIGIYRGIIGSLLFYVISLYYQKQTFFKNKHDFKLLNIRNTFIFIQTLSFAITTRYLQAPIVYTIGGAGPIIVLIIQKIKNKTQTKKNELYGIIIAILGNILTVNSNLIMNYLGYDTTKSKYQYQVVSPLIQTLIALFFFFTMILWSISVLLTKQIKFADAIQINLHSSYITLIYNAFLSFFTQTELVLGFTENLQLMLFVGLPLTLGVYTFIKGIRLTNKPGIASMFGFTGVVFSYILSIFRYNEQPNAFGIAGSIFIFIGLFIVLAK